MKYFWTHRDNIPEGMGFGQFSLIHFIWILITALLTAVYVFFYLQAGPDTRTIMLRSVGAALLISEIVKLILIAFSDVKTTDYLPLEICSFAGYAIVLDSLFPENSFLPMLLLTLFLPGAIMAIFFPTSSVLPAINFYTIHQFLFHGLIIAYVMARFASGEYPLHYLDLWRSIPIIFILVMFMYAVDCIFDKNFMFLRDTYGNPMLEAIRKKTGGGLGYLAGLTCFSIAVAHVFFLIFKIAEILFIR